VRRVLVACLGLLAATGSVGAQFLETFDDPELRFDPSGVEGWSFFSGDGEAEIDLRGTGKGYATIVVDATSDRRTWTSSSWPSPDGSYGSRRGSVQAMRRAGSTSTSTRSERRISTAT
jgi:hypothetical protein